MTLILLFDWDCKGHSFRFMRFPPLAHRHWLLLVNVVLEDRKLRQLVHVVNALRWKDNYFVLPLGLCKDLIVIAIRSSGWRQIE
jgi:hypothetical protein